jgi:hypothetical protein
VVPTSPIVGFFPAIDGGSEVLALAFHELTTLASRVCRQIRPFASLVAEQTPCLGTGLRRVQQRHGCARDRAEHEGHQYDRAIS